VGLAARVVLGVDTASKTAGIALADENGILEELYLGDTKARGERLADLCSQALTARGLVAADLCGVGVCVGPGSYTGLRVGLSFARGVALVDDLPTVGIGSLELLALAARSQGANGGIYAVIGAGRDSVYAAAYQAGDGDADLEEIATPHVVPLDELAAAAARFPGVVLCHENGFQPAAEIADRIVVPEARVGLLAVTAAQRLARLEGVPAEAVLPTYVGATNARKNRNRVIL
jgi:tRNA threonylcarbamoyladenosine biosynthesis protein TsaB